MSLSKIIIVTTLSRKKRKGQMTLITCACFPRLNIPFYIARTPKSFMNSLQRKNRKSRSSLDIYKANRNRYIFNSLKEESAVLRLILNKSRGCAVYAERCPHGAGRGKRSRISLKPEPYLSSYPGAKSQGMKHYMPK